MVRLRLRYRAAIPTFCHRVAANTTTLTDSEAALTDHGKQVGVIDGSLLLVAVSQTGAVEHAGHRQAEVGSKGVDDHGGAHVVGLSVTSVAETSHTAAVLTGAVGRRVNLNTRWKRVCLSTDLENSGHQVLVDGEDGDLQHGHDEELHRAGLPQDRSEGDQHRGCAEVCVDDPVIFKKRKR